MPREEAFCGIWVHPPTQGAGRSSIPSHPSICQFVHPYRPPQAFVFRRARRRLLQSRAFVCWWSLLAFRRLALGKKLHNQVLTQTHSLTVARILPSLIPITTFTSVSHSSTPPLHSSRQSCSRQLQIAKGTRGHGQLTLSHLLANKQRSGGATDGRNQVCCEIEKLVEGREEGRKGVIRLEE